MRGHLAAVRTKTVTVHEMCQDVMETSFVVTRLGFVAHVLKHCRHCLQIVVVEKLELLTFHHHCQQSNKACVYDLDL